MINLLPPQEKLKLSLLQQQKIIIILGSIILLSLLCFILILLSIKIWTQAQVVVQRALVLDKQKSLSDTEMAAIQEKIKSANLNFSQLNTFYLKQFSFVEAFQKIAQVLPTDVYLSNISFSRLPDGIYVSLAGFAKTRNALFELKKKLEENSSFQQVYFPPATWLKPSEIDFSLTLKVL